MTKSDLIAEVSRRAELTRTDADTAVNAVLDAVATALAAGEKVTLVGFGSFSVTTRAARTGRNPRTGVPLKLPESRTVRFKTSRKLRDEL